MKNLLAQKGCHATLLHNDTWSLTLPNGYTLELCFDSEIELCDFLEDLPDMNPVPSTLHARGYTSQRSNTALTSGQTLHQQRQVPPVNINLRAISGRQENGVPKRTQKGSSEVSGHESYIRGDIRETIIMVIYGFQGFSKRSTTFWCRMDYVVWIRCREDGRTSCCWSNCILFIFKRQKKNGHNPSHYSFCEHRRHYILNSYHFLISLNAFTSTSSTSDGVNSELCSNDILYLQ